MAKILKKIYFLAFILLAFYLALPSPDFPKPPDSVYVSFEPADIETPLRRGYYANLSRQEALSYYQKQVSNLWVFGMPIPVPTYRLNHPPEEADRLIRHMTQSTYLEEIVHPFRESFYVNGFEPKEPQYQIVQEGVHYRQKIIVRYAPSSLWERWGVILPSFAFLGFLTKVLFDEVRKFYQEWRKMLWQG